MKEILGLILLLLCIGTASAQKKIVPIVDMKIAGLIGGIEDGKFLDAKTTVEKLAAEQKYTLYLPGGKSENLLLKKPINSQDVCEDFFSLEYEGVDADARHKKGGIALGNGFGWNPQPRAVKPIALDNAAYKKIVNDFLRTKRITTPIAKLDQAFSVDLDGDGRDEIFLAATRIDRNFQQNRRAYDAYSVVLIRKIVGGKPQNIVLDGAFVPKLKAIYDGYAYEISSIADLNGDGKMEIILHSEYYEGSDTSVFELNGRKAVRIESLGAGCGV